MRVLTGRAATVLACALAGAIPAPAQAEHTATDFTLTPASPEAGASVNASSSTTLSYGTVTEDVKKTIGHFAPGLLANPEAVPHCPQALWVADACPADTLIGSSQAVINGIVVENGRIYNQELLEGEAGRLGIIVDAASGKLFLTAPFYVRTTGDYGLDGILDNIPRLTPGTQITKLAFTLFGTVNGRNFTRGPTSCSLKVSTGEAFGYEHDVSVSGPSSSYTPTACERLPFRPTFEMRVGTRGTTGWRQHPPMTVRVTQQQGEAGILGNGVTLPFEIGPHLAALGTVCTNEQLAADACPAGSKVGTANATSPFLATPLNGPVYLAQQQGVVIPGLVADLKGRVPIKIRIATQILGGRLIKSTVTGVPDLPVGTFTLNLDGGDRGVLESKYDLCFSGSKHRRLAAGVTFSAHSGAGTSSKPRIAVEGCGPAARASLRRAAGRRARLTLVARRHPDAENVASMSIRLPRGMRLLRKKARRSVVSAEGAKFVVRPKSTRRLEVSTSATQGSRRVVVRLRRGAVRLTGKVRRALRKGRTRKLRLRVVTVDTAGERFVSRATAKAKRR
ncbi:MAG: hypothetical protein ACRDLQ_02270 [Solirubrobacterales bacterium]